MGWWGCENILHDMKFVCICKFTSCNVGKIQYCDIRNTYKIFRNRCNLSWACPPTFVNQFHCTGSLATILWFTLICKLVCPCGCKLSRIRVLVDFIERTMFKKTHDKFWSQFCMVVPWQFHHIFWYLFLLSSPNLDKSYKSKPWYLVYVIIMIGTIQLSSFFPLIVPSFHHESHPRSLRKKSWNHPQKVASHSLDWVTSKTREIHSLFKSFKWWTHPM